jgi:hypothetical protein
MHENREVNRPLRTHCRFAGRRCEVCGGGGACTRSAALHRDASLSVLLLPPPKLIRPSRNGSSDQGTSSGRSGVGSAVHPRQSRHQYSAPPWLAAALGRAARSEASTGICPFEAGAAASSLEEVAGEEDEVVVLLEPTAARASTSRRRMEELLVRRFPACLDWIQLSAETSCGRPRRSCRKLTHLRLGYTSAHRGRCFRERQSARRD